MKRLIIFVMLLSLAGGKASAQKVAKVNNQDTGGYKLPVVINGQDTLPVYVIEDTRVEETVSPEDVAKQKAWNQMLYDVMRVYPYAQACANKIKDIDSQMAAIDKRRDRNRFLKEQEELVKEEYSKKLEQLNVRQGKLLAKLVSRQTGHTSYSLIKEYKSGLSAFFWQSFASVYGLSLKDEYNPQEEPQIEAVLQYLGYK